MHMNFWWGYNVSDFIFPGLSLHSVAALACLCVVLGGLSFLLEWLKLVQVFHRQAEIKEKTQRLRTVCLAAEDSTLLAGTSSRTQQEGPSAREGSDGNISRGKSVAFLAQEVILRLTIQVAGYGLMLTVMTFNGWVLVAVVIGAGVGYFLFGLKFMKINIENCQAVRRTYCMINCNDPECRNGESTPVMQSSTTTVAVISHTAGSATSCHHSPAESN